MTLDRGSELEKLFAEAAALARGVPEPMQAAAFEAAIHRLAPSMTAGSPSPARSRSLRSTRSVGSAKPRSARSGRPGPKQAIEELIASGYFVTPRVIGELTAYLAAKGWTYRSKEVATSLLRLLREEALRRDRRTDGQYEYSRHNDEGTA